MTDELDRSMAELRATMATIGAMAKIHYHRGYERGAMNDIADMVDKALASPPTSTQDRSGREEARLPTGDFQHEPSCPRLWDLTKTCTCLKDDD